MEDQEIFVALNMYGRNEILQSAIQAMTEIELSDKYNREFRAYRDFWNLRDGKVLRYCHLGFRRFLQNTGLKPAGNHKLVGTRTGLVRWIRCDAKQGP